MELSHLGVNSGVDNSKATLVIRSTFKTLYADLDEVKTHFYIPS